MAAATTNGSSTIDSDSGENWMEPDVDASQQQFQSQSDELSSNDASIETPIPEVEDSVPQVAVPAQTLLAVNSNPSYTLLTLDGNEKNLASGMGSLSLYLSPGHYTLKGTATGFKERSIDVDLIAGQPRTLDLQLTQLPANLKVNVVPKQAEITVSSVGTENTNSLKEGKDVALPAGNYTILATQPNYRALQETVQLLPGQYKSISLQLRIDYDILGVPEITLHDWHESEFELRDILETSRLALFYAWTYGDPSSEEILAELDRLQIDFSKDGLRVVVLDYSEEYQFVPTDKRTLQYSKFTFDVLRDKEFEARNALGLKRMNCSVTLVNQWGQHLFESTQFKANQTKELRDLIEGKIRLK